MYPPANALARWVPFCTVPGGWGRSPQFEINSKCRGPGKSGGHSKATVPHAPDLDLNKVGVSHFRQGLRGS